MSLYSSYGFSECLKLYENQKLRAREGEREREGKERKKTCVFISTENFWKGIWKSPSRSSLSICIIYLVYLLLF